MDAWSRVFALAYDPFLWMGEVRGVRALRRSLLSRARGRVLEIGAGTGLNLAHYPAAIELTLTEPEEPMARRLERRSKATVVRAGAEKLPFADGAFDSIVSTFVLCTVPDVRRAIAELRRVLAPDGQLLLIEHVRGEPGSRLARWQDRLHDPWHAFACGCHANRDTPALLREGGFELADVSGATWRGMPPVVRPIVYGTAVVDLTWKYAS